MYGVAAGQRRLLALQCLNERGRRAAGFTVPVKVIGEDEARLLSFSENAHREAMHPADQIDAFAALADKGYSVEYIASVFGVTPLTVQRRLKLASLSPQLLALIDDQAAQEELWFSLGEGQRSPHSLRRLITANEIDIKNDRLAKFVGLPPTRRRAGPFAVICLLTVTTAATWLTRRCCTNWRRKSSIRPLSLSAPRVGNGWKARWKTTSMN